MFFCSFTVNLVITFQVMIVAVMSGCSSAVDSHCAAKPTANSLTSSASKSITMVRILISSSLLLPSLVGQKFMTSMQCQDESDNTSPIDPKLVLRFRTQISRYFQIVPKSHLGLMQ